ncbi:hypothetical protein RclHR1_17370004 [Rhizophagus clarus]|uniref:Uncharacterized protein n=1 Tax=Rhizophagus clarus TaxID=94130 RepID=A0A2Z6RD22_9GLOM|nr:hypothetical protein RclHR1_17370004 [Rhizophagus clarus]
MLVQNFFRGGLYDILKSRTPLVADYDISKIQTFHFEDWTLFENLVTIFEDYFEDLDEAQISFKDPGRRNTVHLSKVCGWIPRRNFEGLGFPGTLQNFKGLQLLDEDFEGAVFLIMSNIEGDDSSILIQEFNLESTIENLKDGKEVFKEVFSENKLDINFDELAFKFNNVLNDMLAHENEEDSEIESYADEYDHDIEIELEQDNNENDDDNELEEESDEIIPDEFDMSEGSTVVPSYSHPLYKHIIYISTYLSFLNGKNY